MNVALIFAGGVGFRMGNKGLPKQFLEVHRKPVIIYTLEHFYKNNDVEAIVISCKPDWIDYLKELISKFSIGKVVSIVEGGETGQESIYNGLLEIEKLYSNDSIVLIHDGVRPVINQKIINMNIDSVRKHGSAITSCPPVETFVQIDKSNKVTGVNDRSLSRLAKAPQSFFLNDILSAHKRALSENYFEAIDSCSLMAHYGFEVHLVEGITENIKITTPIDFFLFKSILDANEQMAIFN